MNGFVINEIYLFLLLLRVFNGIALNNATGEGITTQSQNHNSSNGIILPSTDIVMTSISPDNNINSSSLLDILRMNTSSENQTHSGSSIGYVSGNSNTSSLPITHSNISDSPLNKLSTAATNVLPVNVTPALDNSTQSVNNVSSANSSLSDASSERPSEHPSFDSSGDVMISETNLLLVGVNESMYVELIGDQGTSLENLTLAIFDASLENLPVLKNITFDNSALLNSTSLYRCLFDGDWLQGIKALLVALYKRNSFAGVFNASLIQHFAVIASESDVVASRLMDSLLRQHHAVVPVISRSIAISQKLTLYHCQHYPVSTILTFILVAQGEDVNCNMDEKHNVTQSYTLKLHSLNTQLCKGEEGGGDEKEVREEDNDKEDHKEDNDYNGDEDDHVEGDDDEEDVAGFHTLVSESEMSQRLLMELNRLCRCGLTTVLLHGKLQCSGVMLYYDFHLTPSFVQQADLFRTAFSAFVNRGTEFVVGQMSYTALNCTTAEACRRTPPHLPTVRDDTVSAVAIVFICLAVLLVVMVVGVVYMRRKKYRSLRMFRMSQFQDTDEMEFMDDFVGGMSSSSTGFPR